MAVLVILIGALVRINTMITMNRMFFSLAVAVVLLSCSSTAHSQASEGVSAASENKEKISSCEENSNYNNLIALECYQEQLVELNKKVNEALQDIYNKSSSLGKDADEEIKGKIRAAQSGWEQYRENHCSYDYISKAMTHPPSQSLRIVRCQVFMTHLRLDEIRKTYTNF